MRGDMVVDRSGGAERRGGDQWAVVREVLAQQRHALSRAAEDITWPQPRVLQAQFAPRPAGQPGWHDRTAVQAVGFGVDEPSAQAPIRVGEEVR
jgi:hypothetical protein